MKYGYVHRFGKNTGGIRQVMLTPACNIKSSSIDPDTGHFLSIALHDPEKLAEYTFAENAVRYREEFDYPNGIPSVTHILEFKTDKIDEESDRLIRQLAALSCCGLAAVITTNNQTRLLVGYSEEHLAERPLKLSKIAADSGYKHTDPGHEAISLISRDTAKAGIFCGNIG